MTNDMARPLPQTLLFILLASIYCLLCQFPNVIHRQLFKRFSLLFKCLGSAETVDSLRAYNLGQVVPVVSNDELVQPSTPSDSTFDDVSVAVPIYLQEVMLRLTDSSCDSSFYKNICTLKLNTPKTKCI